MSRFGGLLIQELLEGGQKRFQLGLQLRYHAAVESLAFAFHILSMRVHN